MASVTLVTSVDAMVQGECTFSSVLEEIYYFMYLSTVMMQICIAGLENC